MKKNSSLHKDMRSITLMKVIKAIRNGAASKTGIQQKTGLSWGSCSQTISLLHDKKLLTPFKIESCNSSKGGRKTTGFKFTSEDYLFLGIEIEAGSVNFSLVNFGLEEVLSKEYHSEKIFTKENLFDSVSTSCNKFLEENGLEKSKILGISISLPGAVDSTNYKLVYSPRYKDTSDIDLNQFRQLVKPAKYFFVEHDISAQASSVIYKNSWTDKNYAFFHFGEGVGMTTYNKGFYTGWRGFTGEIGHLPHHIKNLNKICTCGRKNCYETILSTSGITYLAEKICGNSTDCFKNSNDSIFYDGRLLNVISDSVSELIIMVSNILNPKTVFLGGKAIDRLIDHIRPLVEKKVKTESWLGGPEKIKWYSATDINCAFGTIINSFDKMTEKFIADNLI